MIQTVAESELCVIIGKHSGQCQWLISTDIDHKKIAHIIICHEHEAEVYKRSFKIEDHSEYKAQKF